MRLNVVLTLLVLTCHVVHADAQHIATSDVLFPGLVDKSRGSTWQGIVRKHTVRVEQDYALGAPPQAVSSQSQRKGRISRKKAVFIGAAIGGGIGTLRGALYCGGDCGGWSGKAPTLFGLAGAGIGAGVGLVVAVIGEKVP